MAKMIVASSVVPICSLVSHTALSLPLDTVDVVVVVVVVAVSPLFVSDAQVQCTRASKCMGCAYRRETSLTNKTARHRSRRRLVDGLEACTLGAPPDGYGMGSPECSRADLSAPLAELYDDCTSLSLTSRLAGKWRGCTACQKKWGPDPVSPSPVGMSRPPVKNEHNKWRQRYELWNAQLIAKFCELF